MSAKAYKKHISEPSSVSEPAMPYGDINALKVRTCWQEQFEEDWKRSLSAEDFRVLCKKRLKEY